MKKTLRPINILVYYDGPELFIGADQVGTKYICLLSESTESIERYICSPISQTRLSNFLIGRIDLLEIFKEPETGEIYSAIITDVSETEVFIEQLNISTIPTEWLPESGFFFQNESVPTEIVANDARARNKGIVHLSLNPPESRGDEIRISTTTLADSVKYFQNLVKFAYKRSISNLKPELRRQYESPENYELEVYAFSPGSFKLHMQTKFQGDFAGYTEIFRAMEKIDELMLTIDSPDNALEILKRNKGHLITSFKKFLHLIIENDIPLYYEWSTPSHRRSHKKSITRENAKPIYELLLEIKDLSREQKEFAGIVTEANIETGHWTILNEEDNKHYSGKLDEESHVNLNGVTLGDKKYRFICEERIAEETVSEKEKSHYFMISYESAS